MAAAVKVSAEELAKFFKSKKDLYKRLSIDCEK